MTIIFKGHGYWYEVRNVVMLFFQGQPITQAEEPPTDGAYILTQASREGDRTRLTAVARLDGQTHVQENYVNCDHPEYDKECERVFGILLYHILSPLTGVAPRWGILTGIRPVGLVRRFKGAGMSEEEILARLKADFLVAPQKAGLLLATAQKEQRIIESSSPMSFSLYIAIPFCPSRCLYCSFVSHAVEKDAGLVDDYLARLCEELAYTGSIAKALSLRLETVYIGGGTPTVLSAAQLETLFDAVRGAFDLSHLREYTVEAGRPDTITEDKLRAIKASEATRISINPQTFNDGVLERIGRRHTAGETEESYLLARRVGVGSINMDLIAGLPSDTAESFRASLDRCVALGPENITVHTLSLKRSSNLAGQKAAAFDAREGSATDMLDYAAAVLPYAGYAPYYLYRQRNTKENLENTGFAREGFEGLYNVFIMDETHTILACGAGAVSKLREPFGPRIERIFNYKYPNEYIRGFDQILLRKGRVEDFYDRCAIQ